MPGGAIAAAIIGATTTGIATAAQIASSQISNSKSNLAVSIEVWNSTDYPFTVERKKFRKGAFLGGTEGTFIQNPSVIPSHQYDVFSVEQILGATTDVVGAVLYSNQIMDLLIGFHIFDRFGIHRYISAVPLKKGEGAKLFDENWDAFNLNGGLNKYVWSGSLDKANSYTTTDVKYQTFGYQEPYNMGILKRDSHGELLVNSESGNYFSIRHIDVTGVKDQVSFATKAVGGGKVMQVIISDTPYGDDIYDLTGKWHSNSNINEEWNFKFALDGVRYWKEPESESESGIGTYFIKRDKENFNLYKDDSSDSEIKLIGPREAEFKNDGNTIQISR